MQFAQLSDRVETAGATAGPLDLKAFPGLWVNSNPDTNGIARLRMDQSGESDGQLSLQVYAIGPNGLIDWDKVDVDIFAATPTSSVGAGFKCLYDFGFAETELLGMIMKGLLVLTQFHRFKDDSKRVDYFVREYFALDHGRY